MSAYFSRPEIRMSFINGAHRLFGLISMREIPLGYREGGGPERGWF